MKIKVCGMRDPENIKQVAALGVDMIGLIFYPPSSRYVQSVNSNAGIIPDRVNKDTESSLDDGGFSRVGVFVDEMPQTVVTQVYNYQLDYVQLHGDESVVYIDNLRATLDPDIRKGIQIIKAISISSPEDLRKAAQYEGHADLLLFDTKCPTVGGSGEHFDWSMLDGYKGGLPFILSGGIGPEDAEAIKSISHERMVGVDLNSKFEIEPALKDVEKIKAFIMAIKKGK